MAILPRLVAVAAVCLCTAVGLATCDQLQYSNTALLDVLKRVLPEATAAPQLSIVPVQGAGHGLAITDQGGMFNSRTPPTTSPPVATYKPCPHPVRACVLLVCCGCVISGGRRCIGINPLEQLSDCRD